MVDEDRVPDQKRLSVLIREMQSAGSPVLAEIQQLAGADFEPNSVVMLWRRTVGATTFEANSRSWRGQFALIGDTLVAAPGVVPPIDPARKASDEARSAARHAAYQEWRPVEIARRHAAFETELARWEERRARALIDADRVPAMVRRASLFKLSVFVVWSLLMLVVAVSQQGVINQALILGLFVGGPAYPLRHRLPEWIANCRYHASLADVDALSGARPKPPTGPPQEAAPDWMEPTHEGAPA